MSQVKTSSLASSVDLPPSPQTSHLFPAHIAKTYTENQLNLNSASTSNAAAATLLHQILPTLPTPASFTPTSPIQASLAPPATDEGFVEDGKPDDWGDVYVSSSDDSLDIVDSSEPVGFYSEGLCYPICIGDILIGMYRIVHKLGWGGFSTVWIAQDLRHNKLVALKIGISGNEQELDIQKEILRTVKDTSHCLTYLDAFPLIGANGTHYVMVFPVRGPNIRDCLQELPRKTRMRAAKQLLVALKSLHDADIVHCDLSSRNVLWDIGPIDEYTPNVSYQLFGSPDKLPVYVETWKKGELVTPIQVDKKMIRDNIFLADFGQAIKTGGHVECKWQSPAAYCAPERFHGIDPSLASDMWSYMCLFVQLYLGNWPFYGGSESSIVLSSMVQMLGPLPQQWAGRYDVSEFSKEMWYDQTERPSSGFTLAFERIAEEKPDLSDRERQLALSVCLKVFTYLPEERLTATELLQDKDFNAFMEIYGC